VLLATPLTVQRVAPAVDRLGRDEVLESLIVRSEDIRDFHASSEDLSGGSVPSGLCQRGRAEQNSTGRARARDSQAICELHVWRQYFGLMYELENC
jgi:hypothetical protein